MIKELDTARIIAAISDGMGKGYLAYQESKNTLMLIDEITNSHLDSSTALQIINTFLPYKTIKNGIVHLII